MEYTLTVENMFQNTDDTKTIRFIPDRKIDFKPGQFLMFHIFSKRAAYSIASSPDKEYLEVCVKKVGPSSTFLHELKEGDTVRADGPHGLFTLAESDHHVFIATGTGVAPIRSMVHYLAHNKPSAKITLIFGVKTSKDLLFGEEWDKLDINLIPCLSREGDKIHVQDCIKTIDLPEAHYYVCGLMEMVSDVKKLLIKKGIPAGKIHHEIFV